MGPRGETASVATPPARHAGAVVMAARGVGEPAWPTTVRARKRDGRVQGTDGSVWLYRSVPLAPVADAPDELSGLEPGRPILAALEELAAMTGTRIARRAAAKSGYRQVHLLLVNVPRRFTPDPASAAAAHLAEMFPDRAVQRRLLLFGVRLRDRITGSGWRGAVDSAVETLVSGTVPLSDFDADYADVDQALTRAGLATGTDEDFRLAAAWWNHGAFADTPTLPHANHLHVFTSVSAAHAARPGRPGGLHRMASDPRPARRHLRRGGTVRPRRHPGHHRARPAGWTPWSPPARWRCPSAAWWNRPGSPARSCGAAGGSTCRTSPSGTRRGRCPTASRRRPWPTWRPSRTPTPRAARRPWWTPPCWSP